MKRALVGIIALGALSGCAQKGDLEPLEGATLPVAPTGAEAPPNAEELLTPVPQAAPERSVELRRRSEEREDDPFDLPPPE
ncbi:hypothetical protein QWY75_07140 [Pontixanthobacter aestiaquae]|uniref:Uncharacterized protein n=1 Tax=Pontixanthobacter aestiaquae TaxID=1509367 RepID=A0A844Z878_9SPHN|nr:hypothetical protein [Pontixanthobacter aestiaquae]MDN3645977.1 hypothetical protein [Pontixanthobacter aestiaquae]MXO83030.1 hypothetical protein [Pontixanthobacter aestiaquae]